MNIIHTRMRPNSHAALVQEGDCGCLKVVKYLLGKDKPCIYASVERASWGGNIIWPTSSLKTELFLPPNPTNKALSTSHQAVQKQRSIWMFSFQNGNQMLKTSIAVSAVGEFK